MDKPLHLSSSAQRATATISIPSPSNRPLHSSRITTEVPEMPPNQPTNAPSDIHEWKAAARRKGVNLKISVHTRGPFKSGSKVVEEEFLLLKNIWPKVLPTDKWQVQMQLGLETQFCKETEHLEVIQAFNDSLVAIRNRTPPTSELSTQMQNPQKDNLQRCSIQIWQMQICRVMEIEREMQRDEIGRAADNY
ncbi:hypothetical protein N7449_004110 [Penicillium cf. viridicatum]|uniref:Uncharacterized protein n=1 Tax=Penicillium cf. viridicatum TaxID=2972119 RepID=A0A9W9MY97_9EURO|nr:hypothetical protein N7449_004110 [Penicillium cf. viridicatum]